MSMTTTATRHPVPGLGGSRRALVGLLVLVACLCSAGAMAAPARATIHFDDAHVTPAADHRRHRYSHRLRRRASHPVRPQARRRSRCLAHSCRPADQRPRRIAAAIGPPILRGPPAA